MGWSSCTELMLPRTHAQDPKAVAIKKTFEEAMAAAEAKMAARNELVASRARHAPAGVAYTLMFPSTTSNPVTPDNRGLTGMGIPWVHPTIAQRCPPHCAACLCGTGILYAHVTPFRSSTARQQP